MSTNDISFIRKHCEPLTNYGITSWVVTITPELAQDLIKLNYENNRKPNPGTINRYASDMTSGNWNINGEPIIISEDNILINGQNRLYACIKANTSFQSIITFGVPRSNIHTIDMGWTRTLQKSLEIMGVKDIVRKKAVISALNTQNKAFGYGGKLSTSEYMDLFNKHSDAVCILNALGAFQSYTKPFVSVPALVCYMLISAYENGYSEKPIDAFIMAYTKGTPSQQYATQYAVQLRSAISDYIPKGGTTLCKTALSIAERYFISFVNKTSRLVPPNKNTMFRFK